MKLDVRIKKNKILHCFKRRHYEKLLLRTNITVLHLLYIQCRRRRPVDLPTDCILSFLFLAPKLTSSFQSFPSQQTSSSWFSSWFLISLLLNVFLRSWLMFQIPAQAKTLCCISVIYIQARVSNEDWRLLSNNFKQHNRIKISMMPP